MRMEILAHRTGTSDVCPNSRWGLEWSQGAGAVGVECDVTFVGAGQFLWLDTMQAIIGRPNKAFARMSLEEIATLRRRDCNEGILQLDTVWEFLDRFPMARIYFDVKYYGTDLGGFYKNIPQRFIDLAIQRIVRPSPHKDRIGFTAFRGGLELLRAVKTEDVRVRTDYIAIFPWERIAVHAPYLTSVTIGWKYVNQWRLFPKSIKRILVEARGRSLSVYGGVANTAGQIGWVLRQNFDGLWTDNVPYARYMIQQWERRNIL